MQSGFDDWNDEGIPATRRIGGGGWHWVLTLVALLIVALFTFAMAFLTRKVNERPVWMMGLIFMVPTAALMFAAMLVEGATSAMTPDTSRKPQIILAITATIMTFLVGCICDLIYQEGFRKPLVHGSTTWERTVETDRLILVTDNTKSMADNGAAAKTNEAVAAILKLSGENWEIGLTDGTQTVAAAAASQAQRDKLLAAAKAAPDQGRLYYADQLKKALEMAAGGERKTRIVFFTDGVHPWSRTAGEDLTDQCVAANVSVWFVLPKGTEPDPTAKALAERTGGRILAFDEAAAVTDRISHPAYNETAKAAEIPKNDLMKQDLVRNKDRSAVIITLIMLLLEGLSLGICLSLMMSASGQFRAQYIISPLMGVLAFVLLKLVWSSDDLSTWWIKEGICFSLLGLVIMMKNRVVGSSQSSVSRMDSTDPDF